MPTPTAIGALPFAVEDGAGIAQAVERRFCKPQTEVSSTSAGSKTVKDGMGTEAKRCGA